MSRAAVEAADETVTIAIPRAALTIVEHPRAVSQRTSLTVLGLPPRDYLALARSYAAAGGTVARVGRLRVVELDPLLAWLARRAAVSPSPAAPLDAAAELAAELGFR